MPSKISNHYVIFGRIDGFANILWILRKYTDRPAILYTEDGIDAFKWKDIDSIHKNIYYVKGDYLNIDHLSRLELKSAYKVSIINLKYI